MTRLFARLLAVVGAGTALYALGRYLSAHKIDDKYRLFGPEWGYKLSGGELILYLGCTVAGGFATVLLARALGPAVGERLARLLAARRAPLVLAAFAVAATVATGAVFEHARVYPEESGCELAARALARGRLQVESPPEPGALEYPYVDDAGGRRFGVCGPAAAALVALGRLAGPGFWVVPALLAGLCVLLAAGLARELADPEAPETAGLAAALCAISPALVATATTTAAAVPSALVGLGAVRWGVAWVSRGERADAVRTGLCAGAGLLVQPFDMMFMLVPLCALAVWRHRGTLGVFARETVPALIAAAPFALALLGWSLATTGRLFQLPITHYFRRWGALPLGFGRAPFGLPDHTPALALGKLAAQLVRFDQWLFGWPLSLAAPLGLVVLLGGGMREAVLLVPVCGLAAFVLAAPGAGGAVTGPLVLVPAVPLLAIMTARVLVRLRPRVGGWPFAVALAATLCAAGGFWRLTVLREARTLARRAAAPTQALRRHGVASGLILYNPGLLEYVPPALTPEDPIVFAREPAAGTVRAWLPGRPVWRFFFSMGEGDLAPSE